MALSNAYNPTFGGLGLTSVELVANSSQLSSNSIPPLARSVAITGNANDVNDFIVLPSLSSIPDGHMIIITTTTNCEIRTPASSGEKINGVDSDGTNEYLVTGTRVLIFIKANNTQGWVNLPITPAGATVAAVVPD